jgi:tetratricopeptide (TPR) repeat protein
MTTDDAEMKDADRGEGPEAHPESTQQRWYLNDQRDFLLRSIEDAEREHAAGDLSTADFDVLVLRDQQRLAEVEAELAALGPEADGPGPESTSATAPAGSGAAGEPPAGRGLGPWRRLGIVAACLLIVVGAVILVDHAVSPSLPGQAPSGSVTQSKADELAEAAVLNNNGEAIPALELYQKVLTQDPSDPEALAASGWLEWNYGTDGKSAPAKLAGRRAEKKAIAVAPSYYAGHLFLGLILLNQDHNTAGAIKEFTMFLADNPPSSEVITVAPQVAVAYMQAKLPLPAELAIALASTTTTTTTTTTSPSGL